MTKRSYRTDPALSRRRDAIRAFWALNPATPARDVAERFGVSESTALDAKPYHLRAIRPRPTQWRKLERKHRSA